MGIARTRLGLLAKIRYLLLIAPMVVWAACAGPQSEELAHPVYVLLRLYAGEGHTNYLLLEMRTKDSEVAGRAFFLSHVHDPVPIQELSVKEVGERLVKNQGSCVALKGTNQSGQILVETDELRKAGRSVVWRYRWKVTGSLNQTEPEWDVHQDYWFDPHGYFPSEFSVKASIMENFPAKLEPRKDCLIE